ncbi:formate--tetrahydrofolate ligase, partial [Salmonella enterica subsp. enterica serovar Typhimurium]|nr:formate--tetrahydrofolate ligase [Salmonella enterica subsp. enterica serovar Typhimurium]
MTPLPSDIEIARDAQLRSPLEVAQDMGIDTAQLEPYGHHVAKVDLSTIDQLADRPQ